ncbi:MAG TPA: GTPase Era [Vicinamibacterales bacterium]|nr:GTPase Era [Vicinamibacterales bacterium]
MKSGFVGLVGRPNAGKSTLLNRLVGQKLAIVSDKPQTTRNRIVGVKTLPGGQLIYVDTPGIHRPLHRLNVRMVDISRATLREVDVVALVIDAATEHGAGDNFVWDLVSGTTAPIVVVLNKIDLVAKHDLLPRMAAVAKKGTAVDIVPVSAETGENVGRLEEVLLAHLPESPALFPEDYLTDQPERFFVAELVREQVLRHTHAELPFSSAVVVDAFEEPATPGGLLRLHCSILVERASQKPIVLGRGGAMIKAIGTAARLELERFFDAKVFLDLHVKVKADWREDPRTLTDIGLPDDGSRPKRRKH